MYVFVCPLYNFVCTLAYREHAKEPAFRQFNKHQRRTFFIITEVKGTATCTAHTATQTHNKIE